MRVRVEVAAGAQVVRGEQEALRQRAGDEVGVGGGAAVHVELGGAQLAQRDRALAAVGAEDLEARGARIWRDLERQLGEDVAALRGERAVARLEGVGLGLGLGLGLELGDRGRGCPKGQD